MLTWTSYFDASSLDYLTEKLENNGIIEVVEASLFEGHNKHLKRLYHQRSQHLSNSMAEMVETTNQDLNNTVIVTKVQDSTEVIRKRSIQNKLKRKETIK